MKIPIMPVLLLLLTTYSASGMAFLQISWSFDIEPEHPTTRDLIKISPRNTACYTSPIVTQNLDDRTIEIRLTQPDDWQQCRTDNPDAPNFSTTVGPLDGGDYSVYLWVKFEDAFPPTLIWSQTITVTEAPPVQALTDGGISGLYYNPESDGHYVSILETDYNTLVIWNTFDQFGAQGWVYGVGQLENGKAVIAETYMNRANAINSDGEIDGLEVIEWGTMEVEMDSCLNGSVTYHSSLPEFGNGEFPIKRLAFSKQIGCTDIE